MADLPVSKAKTFLENWARNRFEGASAEEVLEMLADLVRHVDEEYASFSMDQEQKIQKDFEQHFDQQDGDQDRLGKSYQEEIEAVRSHRVALWCVLIGGLKTALASGGQNSAALDALYTSLVDLARGVPGEVAAFDIKRTAKLLPLGNIWARAQIIAAIELYPERKQEILERSPRLLNMSETAISKMVENFISGREPRADLANLVKTVKNLHLIPDATDIDDLLR